MPHDTHLATARSHSPETEFKHVSLYEQAERRFEASLSETHEQLKLLDFPAAEHLAPSRETRPLRDLSRQLSGFVLTDILALFVGFLCAWTVADLINTSFYNRYELEVLNAGGISRLIQFLVLAIGALLWFERTGHYRIRMPFWMETKKIVETMGFAMLINGFLQTASRTDFSRLWLISSWIFAGLTIILFRSAYRSFLRRRGQWQVPTLLVGRGTTAEEARLALSSAPEFGYDIVAQIDDLSSAFNRAGYTWRNLCAKYGADYVVIALEGDALAHAKQQLTQLMRESVPFAISPPLHYLPVLDMMPLYFFNRDATLLTRNSGLDRPFPRFIKRAFDIFLSATSLLLLSPLLLVLALIAQLTTGSAIYGHKRLGMNGKTFACLKFRTMHKNGEAILQNYLLNNPEATEEWHATRKLRHDPRVTRFGALMRRASLDELPQLLNVLLGTMSLVGPRPIVVAETVKYDQNIVDYYRVRPGLTGLWQVSGRSHASYGQRVQMDSWYVRNWSLWHDITIICKTFPVLVKRHGAY